MMIKNIFVTGERGIGKSTLINQWLQEQGLEHKISGFRTLPFDDDQQGGFFMTSIQEIKGNNQPIGRKIGHQQCIPCIETFETLGVALLDKSLKSPYDIILMDELGVLEGGAYAFQRKVNEVLASPKKVVGVIKQKEHPFLEAIKKREDTYVLTLDAYNKDTIKDTWRRLGNQLIMR